jgi:outer membrane protein OmpA-like peptidoglycan-associated protein
VPLAAFAVLAVLSLGAGVATGLLLSHTWVGVAVTFTGALGLVAIRVAELSRGFSWYGVSVFFAVALFGAVAFILRTFEEPRLQPVAFLVKEGSQFRAVEGIYVGKSDDEIWYASIALDRCGSDDVRHAGARLQSVASKDVKALSIGPQMDLPDLAQEARAMRDSLTRQHAGGEAVPGPTAVREVVALGTPFKEKVGVNRWLMLHEEPALGLRHPTLTLNGVRLEVRKAGTDKRLWRVRLPRLARSGPLYAACARRLNRAFLTVHRHPLPMVTATRTRSGWTVDAYGSRDPDGNIVIYNWSAGGQTGHGRTFDVEDADAKEAVLHVRDDTGLNAERTVEFRGRLERVYPSDLLFPFDRRHLSRQGARRLRAFRDEVAGAAFVRVRVYTDTRGSRGHNKALSQARAREVERVLLAGVVPAANRDVLGRGERPEERKGRHRQNRRVVVIILRKPPAG